MLWLKLRDMLARRVMEARNSSSAVQTLKNPSLEQAALLACDTSSAAG